MNSSTEIYIYGSCRYGSDKEKGAGGFAAIIVREDTMQSEISGAFPETTNARMDIAGITEGLKKVRKQGKTTVYLSNENVIRALTKGWLERWEKKGYKKIKHQDLWHELYIELLKFDGQVGFVNSKVLEPNPFLKRAEELAREKSGSIKKPSHIVEDGEKPEAKIEPETKKQDIPADSPKAQHLSYIKEHGKFDIDCSCAIFNEEEICILQKYGHWFKALTEGILEPVSDMQQRFVAIARGEDEPFSIEEKAWYKYLGRKKLEEKDGEKLNVRYQVEDDKWYSNDDIKKMRSVSMKTVWETHSDGAQTARFKRSK